MYNSNPVHRPCPAALRLSSLSITLDRTSGDTIGIDYSSAQTPTASLKGLRVYLAEGDAPPTEVIPLPSPRKY